MKGHCQAESISNSWNGKRMMKRENQSWVESISWTIRKACHSNHLLQVFRYPSIVRVPSKLLPWVSITFGISWENFQMILCLMKISIPNRTSLTLPRTLYENRYISFYLYEPGRSRTWMRRMSLITMLDWSDGPRQRFPSNLTLTLLYWSVHCIVASRTCRASSRGALRYGIHSFCRPLWLIMTARYRSLGKTMPRRILLFLRMFALQTSTKQALWM